MMSLRDFNYSVYFLLLLFVCFKASSIFFLLQVPKIPSLIFLVSQEVSGMGSFSLIGPKSNQLLVGYFHNYYATIALA